jgi:hypothetical protein
MKRYTKDYELMEVCVHGEWVTSSDHDAEVERLRGLLNGLYNVVRGCEYAVGDMRKDERIVAANSELEL